VGKYDFSSYSDSGEEIEDSVSKQMAVFSTGASAPVWESDELKFITGDEFIQLVDFTVYFDSIRMYVSSSVTVSIWIKLKEAPVSTAYIFRCRFKGETVKIKSIP